MNCDDVIDLFISEKDNADEHSKALIENHIQTCEPCRKKIAEIDFLLTAMDTQQQPQPPSEISERFYAFIKNQEKESSQQTVVRTLSKQLWLAASLILLVGLAILIVLITKKSSKPQSPTELVQERIETENLFTNSSASVRIQAITQIDSSSNDQKLLRTLGNMLLHDKNSNVRMAALYSLADHLSDPSVYTVFIDALQTEKDPMLQVLLINTISLKKSPKSAEAIQLLINNSATRQEVRTVAEQIIKTL